MSNDYAVTADVLAEVLERYREAGSRFDILCRIYPMAPFVTAEKLKKAVETLQLFAADALIHIVRYCFPLQRTLLVRDGFVSYQYPQYALTRSQNLESIYHD